MCTTDRSGYSDHACHPPADRDELAALIHKEFGGGADNPMTWRAEQMAADAILAAGWRAPVTVVCQHRYHHKIRPGQTYCCGLPVVPPSWYNV